MVKARFILPAAALVVLSIVAAGRLAAAPQSSATSPQSGTAPDKEPLRYEDTASVEAKAPAVPPMTA